MTASNEIADGVQGQFEGAIRRFDTDDVLSDDQIELYAEKAAAMFAAAVVSRASQQQIEALTE